MVFVILLLIIGLSEGMQGKRAIQASEVESAIRGGEPAEFDNCTIIGDLNLSGLIIKGPVHFNHTTFQDSVNFESTTFNGDANFGHSDFNGTADFGHSDFNGTADFRRTDFNADAYFWYSDFNSSVSFWSSAFNGSVSFWYSDFNGNANFGSSAFNGSVSFLSSAFNGSVSFWSSAFNGYAGFESSAFNGNANFGDSDFNGDAYFWDSDFNGSVSFLSSAFNGYADFESSAFNGDAYFAAVKFNKEAAFDDSQFNNTTSFNSSRFKEDAFFEGSDFNCTIYLIRTKYEKMFIRWRSIKDLAYDDAAYLLLMENFKKLGYIEDYDNCYYEYRKEHRDQDWGGKYHGMGPAEEWIRKRIDAGLEIFYGYGKKPLYPLIWAISTVLLFGIVWRIGGMKAHNNRSGKDRKMGIIEKYGSDKETALKRQSTGRDWRREIEILADAMIFSTTVFLSGTRLFIDPPLLPEMARGSKFQIKAAFTAERVLGAFFSVLFFLSIGATVVR